MKGIKGMACLFFLVVCGLCFCEPAFKAGDVNVEGNGVSVPFYLEEATVLPIGIQAKILYENSVLQPEYVEVEADNQMFCANFDTAGVIDIAGLSLDFVPFEYSKCRKVKKEVDTPYERYPSFYECMDLNAKNDCKYYKKAPAFIRFVRRCFT